MANRVSWIPNRVTSSGWTATFGSCPWARGLPAGSNSLQFAQVLPQWSRPSPRRHVWVWWPSTFLSVVLPGTDAGTNGSFEKSSLDKLLRKWRSEAERESSYKGNRNSIPLRGQGKTHTSELSVPGVREWICVHQLPTVVGWGLLGGVNSLALACPRCISQEEQRYSQMEWH